MKILGFLTLLPKSWQLFMVRFARFCKISEDRGKKTKKVFGVLDNKTENIQDFVKSDLLKTIFASKNFQIKSLLQGSSKILHLLLFCNPG